MDLAEQTKVSKKIPMNLVGFFLCLILSIPVLILGGMLYFNKIDINNGSGWTIWTVLIIFVGIMFFLSSLIFLEEYFRLRKVLKIMKKNAQQEGNEISSL